jgi:hypothetical protein
MRSLLAVSLFLLCSCSSVSKREAYFMNLPESDKSELAKSEKTLREFSECMDKYPDNDVLAAKTCAPLVTGKKLYLKVKRVALLSGSFFSLDGNASYHVSVTCSFRNEGKNADLLSGLKADDSVYVSGKADRYMKWPQSKQASLAIDPVPSSFQVEFDECKLHSK